MYEFSGTQQAIARRSSLEPWADKLIASRAAHGAVVNATEGIELLRERGAVDPHVWLDPALARTQVELIRRGLARVDPRNAPAYEDNARAYAARLAALDARFAAGLRDCPRRDVITSHAAFGYLARRYGLRQIPVMGLAPESEPSPADLAALTRIARERHVRYVFFETLVSSRLAQTLAREVGAETLVLNPIEGLTAREARRAAGTSS
jgi:zinc transport system substrate-binding protein